MKRIPCLCGLALALLPAGLRAGHLDFVTVSATASPVYLKERMAKGSPRRETYTFFQGKFFSGNTRDPSIDKSAFLDLARALAPNLARQNYFPARTARSADLLIVVNWGTTLEDYWSSKDDPESEFQLQQLNQSIAAFGSSAQAGGASSGQALSAAAQVNFNADVYQSRNSAGDYTQNYYSRLLGYGAQLAKDQAHQDPFGIHLNPELESHLSDLTQERYFVILLAYDYQDILRNHSAFRGRGRAAASPPPPLPVWEVRMNVRAAGNTFTQALPAMAQVAGAFYGKNVDGLATLRTDFDQGRVEVGTPKVIEVVK